MKILPRSKIPKALFYFLKESIEDSNDCASDLLEFTGIPNQVFQVSGFAEKPENSDPVLRCTRRARKGKN